ncbi:FAD:protein FMN transferase [Streptacidiphilus carbonis]|uniref:FAD:protein FMN transferase n=1 Tax=Streptacidiphilus carbonis TaxID=105422 RepID=UPI0005A8789B|nr:FAD:protein FMN transferase [Streptacidiphilus carbonis]
MTDAAVDLGQVAFRALGTTAELLVTQPAALAICRRVLEEELAAIDLACSRFRTDSELSLANAAHGRPVTVSPLFAQALDVALHAAQASDGLVDPTIGPALRALGYDRTFASIRPEQVASTVPVPAAGWRSIRWNPLQRRLQLPPWAGLDLGATAKALAADRAAARAARTAGCGVLVNLGGDLSTAGPAPGDGWQVAIADDHAAAPTGTEPVVALRGGALATSGTTVRAWRLGGRVVHHIVEPSTGDTPAPVWRTVSVTAATCVDANTASTAAVLLGEAAPAWLRERALPARLVRTDGGVVTTCGWPEEPLPQGGAA